MSTPQDLDRAREAFARRDFDAAFALAGSCAQQAPALLEAHALRVNAALQLQRWVEAIPHLQLLIGAQPENLQFRRLLGVCHLRIGNVQRDQGQLQAAAGSYTAALQAHPESIDAQYNLGVLLLKSESVNRAVELLREVRRLEPSNVPAALHLATGLIELGQDAAALDVLAPIATTSSDADVLRRCAELLAEAGDPESALRAGLRAFDLEPGKWWLYWSLAGKWRLHGYLDATNALLDEIAGKVKHPLAQFRVCVARRLGLPLVYRDSAHLHAARRAYLLGLDALTAEYPASRVNKDAPDTTALEWDNFFLAYQGEDDRAAQEQYGRWLSACIQELLPQFAPPVSRAPRERPRIALVSSFFRASTVGSYFYSWIEKLARSGFEVILFQLGPGFDDWTEKFRQAAGTLVRLEGPLAERAQKVREVEADLILYPELGMDYRVLAMAALRLAPVQACAWGHPVTTGLPTIDAYFSCAEMEPPDALSHYSEKLITLPGLGTRYASPELPPAPSRADLGLPKDRALYLVPQSPFKLHPDTDAVLVDVLRRDPDGFIVLFDGQTRGATRLLRQRLSRAIAAAGLEPSRHLRFFPQGTRAQYLRVNLVCDVMIDSLYWSGGNTSLDALHCGLPVVTCPGNFMRGRQTLAMLRRLDCSELIVERPEQMAQVAVEIAHDPLRRGQLAQRIGANLPALTDDPVPLATLVDAVRRLLNV